MMKHDSKHEKNDNEMMDGCACGGACGCCEDGSEGHHDSDHCKECENCEGCDHDHHQKEQQERIAYLEETIKRREADYQNMMRRHEEQSQRKSKLAAAEFAFALAQPLSHLELAAKQLNDKGLNMVITQLWQQLSSQGLQQIGAVGDDFNPHSMEAISQEGEGTKVVAVSQPGYTLHGEVIQPAKVVVGSMTASKK